MLLFTVYVERLLFQGVLDDVDCEISLGVQLLDFPVLLIPVQGSGPVYHVGAGKLARLDEETEIERSVQHGKQVGIARFVAAGSRLMHMIMVPCAANGGRTAMYVLGCAALLLPRLPTTRN